MASARTLFVASGAGLAVAAAVAVVLRLVGRHTVEAIGHLPAPAFYAIAALVVFIAVLLVMNAPRSRKRERRVALRLSSPQDQLVRPNPAVSLPQTRGMNGESRRASNGGHGGPTPGAVTNGAGRRVAAVAADGGLETPREDGGGGAHQGLDLIGGQGGGASRATLATRPGPQHATRRGLRRDELQDRLEVLQQKADSVKVKYGLGRISSAGYRQFLMEVDQERTLLEAELMSLNEED